MKELTEGWYGVSVPVGNAFLRLNLLTWGDVLHAYNTGILDPGEKGTRGYGYVCHREVARRLGLPEPDMPWHYKTNGTSRAIIYRSPQGTVAYQGQLRRDDILDYVAAIAGEFAGSVADITQSLRSSGYYEEGSASLAVVELRKLKKSLETVTSTNRTDEF
jgi:hypothetical protein